MPKATPPIGYEVKFQRVGVGGGADLQIRSLLDKQQYYEVGCGLGLASLVVHRREGNIIASDCHPLTETFLKANVLLNGLPPLPYETGNWGRVNKGLGAFDLLIASDVLYERSHPAQLSGFIQEHAAEGAEVLIVDPNRGNRSAFHKDMANMGFGVTEIMLNEPLKDLSAYRGRLLHYTRG
jgi:predicted nicotinamide N-methyase